MQWLSTTTRVLYYILYPIYWLATWIVCILHWIASPFIYVWYLLKGATTVPFRFLARFEVSSRALPHEQDLIQFQALWYFLGSAILIGILLAGCLHLVLQALVLVFGLDRKPKPQAELPIGHDAASYRAARQAKKQKELQHQQKLAAQARLIASQPLMQQAVREAREAKQGPLAAVSTSPMSPVSPGTGRPALLQETILEHTDEEDDDSVF